MKPFASNKFKQTKNFLGLLILLMTYTITSRRIKVEPETSMEMLNIDFSEMGSKFSYDMGTWKLVERFSEDKMKLTTRSMKRFEFHPEKYFVLKMSKLDKSKFSLLFSPVHVLAYHPGVVEKPFLDRSWQIMRPMPDEEIKEPLVIATEKDLKGINDFKDKIINYHEKTIYDVIEGLNEFPYYEFFMGEKSLMNQKLYNVDVQELMHVMDYPKNIMENHIEKNEINKNSTDEEKNYFYEAMMAQLIKFLYGGEIEYFRIEQVKFDNGNIKYKFDYFNRAFDSSARALAKKLTQEKTLTEEYVKSFYAFIDELSEIGFDFAKYYICEMPLDYFNEFFRNYEDGDTMTDLVAKNEKKRMPNIDFHEEIDLKLNTYIFSKKNADELDENLFYKKYKDLGKKFVELLKGGLTILMEYFITNPDLELEVNMEPIEKVKKNFKHSNHFRSYTECEQEGLKNQFNPETDYMDMLDKMNPTLYYYIEIYFIDYALNAWEGGIMQAILSSQVFVDLKLDNPESDPNNFKLIRSILYSAGLVDYVDALDKEHTFYEKVSVFQNQDRLII